MSFVEWGLLTTPCVRKQAFVLIELRDRWGTVDWTANGTVDWTACGTVTGLFGPPTE